MKLLLTNDDGIQGEGLLTLAAAYRSAGHEATIVAPRENNSAVSHKLTMYAPIKIEETQFGFALDGSPADCVLIALKYLGICPDLIVAGINAGVNVGSDVLYSGTVAAALEGAQNGIPSLALSQYIDIAEENRLSENFAFAARYSAKRLSAWAELAREAGAVNINFPCRTPRGERFCELSHTIYQTTYRAEAEGLRMDFSPPHADDIGDLSLLSDGYITLTPLSVDLTDHRILERWKNQ